MNYYSRMNLELYPPKEPNRAEHPFTHSTRYKGLDIDIENADGSVRSGVDANGKPWETKFDGAHYGEIRGYKGADGDAVDVYLASAPDEEGFDKVFIIHQNFPGNHPEKAGEFDEDKVVLGVRDVDEAKALYLKHYDRADYLRSVTEMPFDQFIASLKNGDGESKIANVIAKAFERASAVENASKATDSAKKKKDKKPIPFIRSHMREGGTSMLKKAYDAGVRAALQAVGLVKEARNTAHPKGMDALIANRYGVNYPKPDLRNIQKAFGTAAIPASEESIARIFTPGTAGEQAALELNRRALKNLPNLEALRAAESVTNAQVAANAVRNARAATRYVAPELPLIARLMRLRG